MSKRIFVVGIIYVCTCVAWFVLGGTTAIRTDNQDMKMRNEVGRLWGSTQRQPAPVAFYETQEERDVQLVRDGETVTERRWGAVSHPVRLESSRIVTDLHLDHRKKGLQWYATYQVAFSGTYVVENPTEVNREIHFVYSFPSAEGVYDSFTVVVDGITVDTFEPTSGQIDQIVNLEPGESVPIQITYRSQGMDQWWYVFGHEVSQIRDFQLTMTTDFRDIDFPENSMSPTTKEETGNGWKLTWDYSNLISGIQIGMDLPQKLNPGPFVTKLSLFAPVSLFLFLFLMFIVTTIKKIDLHPMNLFFLCAAFFSFHLLLAYLVDHIDIHLAMAISTVVSMFLVISYMRLVVGPRFAAVETGLSQFVYLVLFSYAFFLEGYTGLTITICCIVTLFVVMQFTGRIDWTSQLAGNGSGTLDPPAPPKR